MVTNLVILRVLMDFLMQFWPLVMDAKERQFLFGYMDNFSLKYKVWPL